MLNFLHYYDLNETIGTGTYKFHHYSTEQPTENGYITFSSNSSFTITAHNGKTWDNILEYSTDTINWSTWTGDTISSVNNVLYLRGLNNTVITNPAGASYPRLTNRWIINGSNVKCSGNIETLLDYQTVELGNHPTMLNCAFEGLFANCTALIEMPKLNSVVVQVRAYGAMFYGCTNLTEAKDFPTDVNLSNYSCSSMFEGCTSLIKPPASIPQHQYFHFDDFVCEKMFKDCTSLTYGPQLPATNLPPHCYDGMFEGCTSLTTMPELPATTLSDYCYYYMFYGCISLQTVQNLPATTLAPYCYGDMFGSCISLTELPQLPATYIPTGAYVNMFNTSDDTRRQFFISRQQQMGIHYLPYTFRIPTTGTGSSAGWNTRDMFATYTEGGIVISAPTPAVNTTYYSSLPTKE